MHNQAVAWMAPTTEVMCRANQKLVLGLRRLDASRSEEAVGCCVRRPCVEGSHSEVVRLGPRLGSCLPARFELRRLW